MGRHGGQTKAADSADKTVSQPGLGSGEGLARQRWVDISGNAYRLVSIGGPQGPAIARSRPVLLRDRRG